jgi:hypothetical protein
MMVWLGCGRKVEGEVVRVTTVVFRVGLHRRDVRM